MLVQWKVIPFVGSQVQKQQTEKVTDSEMALYQKVTTFYGHVKCYVQL